MDTTNSTTTATATTTTEDRITVGDTTPVHISLAAIDVGWDPRVHHVVCEIPDGDPLSVTYDEGDSPTHAVTFAGPRDQALARLIQAGYLIAQQGEQK